MTYLLLVLAAITLTMSVSLYFFYRIEPVVCNDFNDFCTIIKTIDRSGRGTRTGRERRILKKCYKILITKGREECLSFEKWIRDNGKELIMTLKDGQFKRLPHVRGIPRIMLIADYIVNEGADINFETILERLKSIMRNVRLDHGELRSFSEAIKIAEAKKVSDISANTIRYEKEKLAPENKKNWINGSNSSIKFYADKYETGDIYDTFIVEARQAFADELLLHERAVSKAICGYKNSYKLEIVKIFEKLSECDKIFQNTDNYYYVSSLTKLEYLDRVKYLSDKLNVPETSVAETAVYLAGSQNKDLGVILFDDHEIADHIKNRSSKVHIDKLKIRKTCYLSLIAIFSLTIGGLPLILSREPLYFFFSILVFLLAIKPSEVLAKRIFSYISKPPVFSMGYRELPENAKTVVVVSQFVDNDQKLEAGFNKIKSLSENCKDKKVDYCLLVDLPESKEETTENDISIIEKAKELFKDQKPLIYIRKKVYSIDKYKGKERKKGRYIGFLRVDSERRYR